MSIAIIVKCLHCTFYALLIKKLTMKKLSLNCLKVFLVLSLIPYSCTDSITPENEVAYITKSAKSIVSPTLDWENVDWMPTPMGQPRIPSPWSGQGSIASTWGVDVMNDRFSKDGWILLYNTFETDWGPLVNPYFILYNKYNGVLRIYVYITTQFLYPTSYIQDGIALISNHKLKTLEFNGNAWVDTRFHDYKMSYSQIQPAAMDGSLPLASNKWYMLQYEMQYDGTTGTYNSDEVYLSWYLNFFNVQTVSLGGKVEGSIKSAVGNKDNGFFKKLASIGETVGIGAVAGAGHAFLEKNRLNETGDNKLGLPDKVFQSVSKGVLDAVKSSGKDIPSKISGLFSSVLSSNGNDTKLVNLIIDAEIKLNGTATEGGSFPSSPTAMMLPGTKISPNTTGLIPLYNKELGVFHLPSGVTFYPIGTVYAEANNGGSIEITNCSSFLKDGNRYYSKINALNVNPAVKDIADVKVVKAEFLFYPFIHPDNYRAANNEIKCERVEVIDQRNEFMHVKIPPGVTFKDKKVQYCYVNPTYIYCDYSRSHYSEEEFMFGLRYTLQVTPKDGSSVHTIVKTFRIKTNNRKLRKL